jgi:phosphatidylinositol alpha-1,6-mannosyltransferase
MDQTRSDSPAVVVFSGDYKPLTGGVAEHAYRVACAFRRRGYRVVVLAPRIPGGDEFDREAGLTTYRLDVHPGVAPFEYALALARIVREHGAAWVYAATANPGALACAAARAFVRFRYSVTVHGHELTFGLDNARQVLKTMVKPVYSHVLGKADRVFAVSEFTRASILRAGLDPGRVATIYNGIDLDDFGDDHGADAVRARYSLEGKRILLTVAALDVRKGHDTVIRALPQILKGVPDTVYVVVGAGPNEKRLKGLARETGVAARVLFTGSLPRADVLGFMAASDVFAMVSRQEGTNVEGFGIVFLEAAAMNKPVVGGRSGGIPDAVEDGVTGLLVDPLSPGEVSAAVLRIMKDPALARSLGEAGYERTARLFTWDEVVERILVSIGTL